MDSIVEENGNSASSSNVNDDTGDNFAAAVAAAAAAAAAQNNTQTQQQQQQTATAPSPQQQQQQQQQQQNQQSTTTGSAATVATAPPPPPPNVVQQQQQQTNQNLSVAVAAAASLGNAPLSVPPSAATAASVLTTTANVAGYPLTALAQHGIQVQSVIQAANQSSVIQTAAATNPQTLAAMHKSNVLFVSKPNTTVIHTTAGNAVQIPPNFPCKIKPEPNTQQLDTNSEDSLTDEDSPHRRSELTRRPSYNKIFTEISGPDITAGTTLQMSESVGLATLPGTGGSTTSSLIHMPQDSASTYFIPNRIYNTNNSVIAEDQSRKREIRLQKNREAARECRRKKKEYIKCLENRVAVLENQNKALIEELKSLKELYCQTKND